MKTLVKFALLFAIVIPAVAQTYDWRTGFMFYAQNESATGTIQYHNVKSTGDNPSKVIRTSTTDAMAESGTIGICVVNCGTAGLAGIVQIGVVPCAFDGPTTANNFVQLSDTQNGKCKDVGSSRPQMGRIVGRVLSTNGGAGTYDVLLAGLGLRGHPNLPMTSTGKVLRDDGTWVADQTGSGSTPTGTGFRRIVGGVEDAAASEPAWTQVTGKPSTFPPDTHGHVKADVSDFAHAHPQSEVTNLVTDLAGKAAAVHTHVGADILTGAVPLATALAANGANCPNGQAPLGVDANGVVEGCFVPGGGSGVPFREFLVCSGGCNVFTNLGAGPTEMANQRSRSRVDLSQFTDARVITVFSAAAVSGDFQIECADATSFASITDLLQWDNPAANVLTEGTWTTIPAGCKTSGGVYIRVVGINGNGSEDPLAQKILLQVR